MMSWLMRLYESQAVEFGVKLRNAERNNRECDKDG